MTTLLRIEIPLRTRSVLNGAHGHWAANARERKAQRNATALVLRPRLHGWSVGAGAIVTLTRIAPSNGLDSDNLGAALKSVRDGVADALAVDDRDPRVVWHYAQERGKSYAVRIELARLKGAA